MPESTFEWASKRPVSLLWGFASFAISFLSAAEFSPRLKPSKLRLSWRGVKERKEYYRLFTCLVTVEKLELPSLGLAVLAFALGTLLEARVFMRQPLSFLSSYLAAGGFIISSGFVYKELISRNYSEAFELMVVTWFAEEFSNQQLINIGLCKISTCQFLPALVLGLIYFLNGQVIDQRIKLALIGEAVGYIIAFTNPSVTRISEDRRLKQQKGKKKAGAARERALRQVANEENKATS